MVAAPRPARALREGRTAWIPHLTASTQGWSDTITAYFTFGPGETVGVWILTILGVILMIGSLVAWFWMENQKLQRQAERLRAGGLKTETMPGGAAHHIPGNPEG